MTQIKWQEKYGNSLRLVERQGRSNIILLERVSEILGRRGAVVKGVEHISTDL